MKRNHKCYLCDRDKWECVTKSGVPVCPTCFEVHDLESEAVTTAPVIVPDYERMYSPFGVAA